MLSINSPYDNHLIRNISLTDSNSVESIIQTAYDAFQDRENWLPPNIRMSILENFFKLVQLRKIELALLASEEGGKPLVDSRIEVARALDSIQIAKEYIRHLTGQEIPMRLNESSLHKRAFTYNEPIGVVYAISAFNHPVNLIIHQVITAVAVGCPVIIKPSSLTPLSCINLVNILYEAGLPKKWCQVIICNNITAEKLVSDHRISYFSFIGSPKVGWYLRSKLAPGTKCTLEHGGVAPVIVEPDADLNSAIPGIVRGGYYHAGQVCVSVQRIFVHQKIIKKFTKLMLEEIDNLIVGDPLLETTTIGPIISNTALKRIYENVQEAEYNGGKILVGGSIIKDTCFEPTLILNPSIDSFVSQREIFGPVVCLYSYQEIDNAISIANNLPYQFQAAIFTKNLDTAWKGIHYLKSNTVLVNEQTAFRVDWMPFGGQNESGIGIGGIPYIMRDLTYEKLAIWHSEII
ncbi:MAG: aldehyde dehydrogenase family protein [Legionellales bacterium]|nr:aldehyde dehydrogenase family protein [Legionellales bacterium]